MKRFTIVCFALGMACQSQPAAPPTPKKIQEPPAPVDTGPTVADAAAFVKEVEAELLDLWIAKELTEWVKATYITHDTDLLAARANEALMAFVGQKASEAMRFADLKLPFDLERKMELLKLNLSLPAPADPQKRKALAEIAASMESLYGKGKYRPSQTEDTYLTLGDLSRIMAKSRDFDELKAIWQGWRTISRPMREDFEKFVDLGNQGAVGLGFDNLGDLWKSRYDMPPAEFEAEIERLWDQLKPFYNELHCYVRQRLSKRYGKDKVPLDAPIPAHLLGNMWSQDWSNIYDLVAPEDGPRSDGFDLTEILRKNKYDEDEMVRKAEAFFVSLGLEPLPVTFWERSLFTKPGDREVVCHASAWDVDWKDDLRIKMCIEITAEDFTTIHHELGHNYYQRAYKDQPPLFTNSANDGFHEALGDLIALSVTPGYLVEIGLIKQEPPQSLGPLLRRALDKIAFLPFGLIVDKWRFDVFSGDTAPKDYNEHWWRLRTEYQGIAPPVERSEEDFDPGAKYHVPANVPYTRYFIGSILQFQFHRALCRLADHQGPLHTCSIYGNKEAGDRLSRMMRMGASRPWPEALKALTGEDRMDATAIAEYFEPLIAWLKKQNEGLTCGW